jgi:adenylate kinase
MSHNYLIFGVQGAGKGTQAKILSERLSIPHISSGDLLREAAEKGTKRGIEAKHFWEKGNLVPDELMIPMFEERFAEADCRDGFILDGFPRTVEQGKMLGRALKKLGRHFDVVLYLDIDEKSFFERLKHRWLCRSCGKIYNTLFAPPLQQNVCDVCGGELYQRVDDLDEDAIRKRVHSYRESTEEVIDYYRTQKIVTDFDGTQPIEKVAQDIADKLHLNK